jgi:hypothetical protein
MDERFPVYESWLIGERQKSMTQKKFPAGETLQENI